MPKLLDLTNNLILDKILVKAIKAASLCVVVEGAGLQEIHSNFLKLYQKNHSSVEVARCNSILIDQEVQLEF